VCDGERGAGAARGEADRVAHRAPRGARRCLRRLPAAAVGGRPDDVPATEIVLLYDARAEQATVILFFDNEDDYNRGDATLSAMPADDTPGQRTSVGRYEVAVRATA